MIKAKDKSPKVLPVWQPIGYSTHQISKSIGGKYGTKATHTGTLDPLAEGVIIILLGDERFKKYEYAEYRKVYEFEIAFGISTDSYDGMGLVADTDFKDISKAKLKSVIESFKGDYEQRVPLYSAKKVESKKLFLYPKKGIDPPNLPVKKGMIYEIRLLNFRYENLGRVINSVVREVEKIESGEFRQDQIIKRWKDFMDETDLSARIPIAKVYVETSRGIYVRSLSQDIAKELGALGFVYSLVRVRNGEYTKKDCVKLKDIFGKDFLWEELSSKFRA